ncbi:hypothetical protein [Salinisphaera hydrothermalis]|uniref:Uncharacterized protein n=1 Tax=Salinisphaera hydrothermalis (strain C41B8) TaxID=1304275 RepID=A0A084INL4_SALHC|nr:hypothetical protein [Salinisphaera hydrothermalis]KEZ78298.1 hypothetical protein C41B8_05333 [Salinisphaera hydrothermalis C41B8]
MSPNQNITAGRLALAFVAMLIIPTIVGIVSGIVVAKYSSSQRSSIESARQLRNTVTSLQRVVDQLQSKFANLDDLPTQGDQAMVLYRVQQLEDHMKSNDGRIENLNNTQIRICQKVDMVCAGKNAVWMKPWPDRRLEALQVAVTGRPWPPRPRRDRRVRVALHDTFAAHRYLIEPVRIE